MDQTLDVIETTLSAGEAKERMQRLSKKGKLPGFDANCKHGIFSVAAHGTPFDSELIFEHQDGRLTPTLRLTPMIPSIFAALLVITVWPGLPLTDGFLASFTWYGNLLAKVGIDTWHWYLPITILPAPFMWKSAIRKSKESARASAIETIELARKTLKGS